MKKIILKAAPKKQKNEKGGKMFYSLIFLAIVTVGTTGYIMRVRKDAITKLSDNTQIKISEPAPMMVSESPVIDVEDNISVATNVISVPEEQWQSDDVIPVSGEIVNESLDEADSEPKESKSVYAKASATSDKVSLIMPVDGETIKNHSDTELSYSKTMEDWRLHKGMDIGASIGSTVVASADGTVSECYTDTAYGVTVIIDHGDGLFSKYSNLSSTDMVSVGKQISAGDAIGVVGDTAEFEIAEEAHLHFEVIKDGRSVDPEEYID